MSIKKSLNLLCDGYKSDFASYVVVSEEFTEMLMTLSNRFVEENIKILENDDDQTELAFLMMESIKLGNF